MKKKKYKNIYILLFSNMTILSLISIFMFSVNSIVIYLYCPLILINNHYIKDAKKEFKNIDGIIVWLNIIFIICMSVAYLHKNKAIQMGGL